MGELDVSGGDELAEALDRLRAGNARFLDAIADAPDPSAAVAGLSVADPYAVVLGCSDSRVPPELVFDEAVGRLFVVRVAGNVAGNEQIGSIEYAVERWNCRAVVVLGHTQCAAVAAAMDPPPTGAEPPPDLVGSMYLSPLLGSIRSNLGWARSATSGDPWADAVRGNVRRTVERLGLWSLPIRRRVDAGELRVVGAIYHVETGNVEFLGPEGA